MKTQNTLWIIREFMMMRKISVMTMTAVTWLALLFVMNSLIMADPARAEEMPAESGKETLYLDLKGAVEIGLAQNPRIQAADFDIERRRSEVKSLRGRFLPRLSAGYSWNHLENIKAKGQADPDYLDHSQESWRINIQQVLFAGGTVFNTYQRARLQEEVSHLEKQGEQRELIRRIQEVFLLLLKAKEDQRSLEQTVQRLEVSKDAAENFASRQMLPFVEVLQARVELEEARQMLGQVTNLVAIYEMRLNTLLDLDDQYDVIYAGDLADIELDKEIVLQQCLETAKKQRTDLQYLEKRIEIADKEKSIATGRGLPRVTLDVSAVDRTRDYDQMGTDFRGNPVSRDQGNQYWSAGVNVEWHMFSGGEHYYQRQGMNHEMERLKQLYKDAASGIRNEVRSAYLRMQEARLRVGATRSNLETAREGYRMESERLERQVGTIQALLNAQEQLTRADANQNQAMLDYQLALMDLYFAMGVKNYALN